MSIIIPIRVTGKGGLDKLQREFVKTERTGKKAFRGVDAEAKRLRTTTTGLVARLGAARNKLLVFGFATAGVSKVFSSLVSESSNLEESINAVNVVFGDGADIILRFGENAAESVGLATSEFNQLATVTGALLKDTGLSLEDVANKTNILAERAADMASVFNTDVKDALSAINQSIRGETEAIRRYAGDTTDATLQTFLLSKGIDKQVSSLSQQEKRLFVVDLLMSQTAVTAGDFANTSDGFANSMRILGSEIKNVAAELGEELLPKLANFATSINNILKTREEFSEFLQQFDITPGITKFVDEIERLEEGFGKMLSPRDKFDPFIALIDKINKDFRTDFKPFESLLDKINNTAAGERALSLAAAAEQLARETEEENEFLREQGVVLGANVLIIRDDMLPAHAELGEKIKENNRGIAEAPEFAHRLTEEMELAAFFGEQMGQALSQALIFGKGLEASIANIVKQLASTALINFLRLSLSGQPLSAKGLLGFAEGGVVPGPIGQPQLAIVHGQEEVLTPQQRITNNNTKNNISLSFPNVTMLDEFTIRTEILPTLNRLVQEGGEQLTASGTV